MMHDENGNGERMKKGDRSCLHARTGRAAAATTCILLLKRTIALSRRRLRFYLSNPVRHIPVSRRRGGRSEKRKEVGGGVGEILEPSKLATEGRGKMYGIRRRGTFNLIFIANAERV